MQKATTLTLADRLIPWYFVMFFVLLTGLLSYFCWLAVSSYTGLVTEDAYSKGVQYNQILRQAAAQEALGWKADVVVTPGSGKKMLITVMLKDKDGLPIKGAKAKAFAQRPTLGGVDKKVPLYEHAEGVYTVNVTLPLAGVWDMYLSFVQGNNRFQLKKTVFAQP